MCRQQLFWIILNFPNYKLGEELCVSIVEVARHVLFSEKKNPLEPPDPIRSLDSLRYFLLSHGNSFSGTDGAENH